MNQALTLAQALQAGMAHFQSGRLAQAETIFRQILAVDPTNVAALDLMGCIAHQQGHYQAALGYFDQALQNNPKDPYVHFNRSVCLEDQEKWEEAEAAYRRVIALRPDHAKAHNKLGLLLQRRGELKKAEASYRRAITLSPDADGAHNNLGSVLQELGRLGEAEACYVKALSLNPRNALAHNNLGVVLQRQGKLVEALASYRRALDINPDYADAYNNRGSALQDLARPEEAVVCYRKALQLNPDFARARWNLATALLLSGDFADGLALYENRFEGADKRENTRALRTLAALSAKPRWQGEDLRGRTIFVWHEQGLGDDIMMLRYLPMLKEKGAGDIIVSCRSALTRILQTFPVVTQVIAEDSLPPLDSFDCHCPRMSLPYVFGTRLETIPREIPYIAVPQDMTENWARRLADIDGLKVGLVWAGSKTQKKDSLRSIPPQGLLPLMAVSGVQFISLQQGGEAPPLTTGDKPLIDRMAECQDLLETAALAQQLDLVISVDTAVAHLAGALGKPVWLLNRFESEWRWMLDREDSPWYPTMRIFRQPALHDWDSVITRVAGELRALLAGQKSG
jgi:tetratricopeptide (TPR) repeat protein